MFLCFYGGSDSTWWPWVRAGHGRNVRAADVGRSADDVCFEQGAIGFDARERELGEIQRVEASVQNEFGDRPADDRRLLHAVTREAVHEQQIPHGGMRSYDSVLVKLVHFEVARPGALQPGGFECRDTVRE